MENVFRIEEWTNDEWTLYLKNLGWIPNGSTVFSVDRMPGGNMNLSLKVKHRDGILFLKQGRPWVEKFPEYAAPWGRTELEAEFYRATKDISEISSFMPRFIGVDVKNQVMAIDFLDASIDGGVVYRSQTGTQFYRDHSRALLGYLEALKGIDPRKISQKFSENKLRPLNAYHIYDFPFLDTQIALIAEKSGESLSWLRSSNFNLVRDQLKADYFSTGPTLLHGDFYPGSFLLHGGKLMIIDPEFCILGRSEFDVGNLMGHLILAGGDASEIELEWQSSLFFRSLDISYIRKVAGVEILRRLLGVAKVHESVVAAELTRWITLASTLTVA